MTRAVVLGGGGVTGVAWSIGLLAGLAAEGVDLAGADLVVGTSAGSVVGAQLANRVPLDEQYAAQLAGPGAERVPPAPGKRTVAGFALALARHWRDPQRFRARVGALSLAAPTVPEAERRAIVAARLTVPTWPATDLRLVAVDAVSGEVRVFDRSSGVPLVDAVTASCAIPGMWPPATVDGRRYVDGGIASGTNAALAAGHSRVLIVAPLTAGGGPVPSAAAEAAWLTRSGAEVLLLAQSRATRRAVGPVSDPANRPTAARAGREYAASQVQAVRALWG
jgi:NTE family protein